jgi:hypothetical protein
MLRPLRMEYPGAWYHVMNLIVLIRVKGRIDPISKCHALDFALTHTWLSITLLPTKCSLLCHSHDLRKFKQKENSESAMVEHKTEERTNIIA